MLENVPCALEKKVYLSAFGWNVLNISMRSILSNVSFKICVSLLIFCFNHLSIRVNGVLKSPTIIVLLSISPFMSVSVCLMYCGDPMLGAWKWKWKSFSHVRLFATHGLHSPGDSPGQNNRVGSSFPFSRRSSQPT